MITPAFPRRLAAALLQSAIAIAPNDTLEWGHAMLGELRHVEGNWSALFWSLGSAGVLAKHALVALIFPSGNRPTIPSGGDLFSKEGSMRKPALIVVGSCIVASLLFFLAPVFRQAFVVSLAQWHEVFHVHSPLDEPQRADAVLESLTRKAEQNRDAEGMAFAALHNRNQSQSVRLADEAVRLDPKLTWVYAVIAVKFSSFPEIDRWVSELEKYDPQNALPHLIVAEKIDIDKVVGHQVARRRQTEDEPAAWQDAMAAAFASPKLDTYSSQYDDLEVGILSKYEINDPFQALDDSTWWYGLPSFSSDDTHRFARSLVNDGEKLEAQGAIKGASEKYSQVARFGQLVGPRRYLLRNDAFRDALVHLEKLSRKQGNEAQASFYASLADDAEIQRQETLNGIRRFGGDRVARWDAFVARASGAAMLFSGLLLATCLVAVVIRGRSIRLAALRPSGLTLALSSTASVVALLSSVMLYVSYRPYSEIFERFVKYGDDSGLRELAIFLAATRLPLGAGMNRFLDFQSAVFYFWAGVAVLSAAVLLFAILRHLQTRHRPAAA
jgi:hypothetical protein